MDDSNESNLSMSRLCESLEPVVMDAQFAGVKSETKSCKKTKKRYLFALPDTYTTDVSSEQRMAPADVASRWAVRCCPRELLGCVKP
jgi:hypothetical protein